VYGAGKSLRSSFDYVWGRLTARLEGLDEEYFWEPVKGCWSLRISPDGIWRLDGGGGGGPAPDPVPVTTITWRLGHLGGLALGGFTERLFPGAATDYVFASQAAEVPEFLAARYTGWRAGLAGLDETEWEVPSAPTGGHTLTPARLISPSTCSTKSSITRQSWPPSGPFQQSVVTRRVELEPELKSEPKAFGEGQQAPGARV
jgi:hypothetical protein